MVWETSWPAAAVAPIAALYADGAVFHSHPFRNRDAPAAYVTWAFDQQAAAECRFGTPIVDGSRAAVDWWAVVTAEDGTAQTLAGVSLLRFDHDGRVVEQRDVWAYEDAPRELSNWAPAT